MRGSASLLAALRNKETTPTEVVAEVLERVAERGDDGTWISLAHEETLLDRAAELESDPTAPHLPLYGIPFGVKDSIDIAGWPTTLACPAYAYPAERTAPVVERLLDAGAILVGKTNLDQFATGLNGTRTPYPVPRSVLRRRSDLRRLELGLGPRGRHRRGAVRRGHRHGRLGPGAARPQRHPRLQAVPRADQHGRPGAGLPLAGLHQPDGHLGRRPAPGLRRGRRRRRPRPVEPAAAAHERSTWPRSGSDCPPSPSWTSSATPRWSSPT